MWKFHTHTHTMIMKVLMMIEVNKHFIFFMDIIQWMIIMILFNQSLIGMLMNVVGWMKFINYIIDVCNIDSHIHIHNTWQKKQDRKKSCYNACALSISMRLSYLMRFILSGTFYK